MKAVVQRVLSGSVRVEGEVVASIGKGFVALIGIHRLHCSLNLWGGYFDKRLLPCRDDTKTEMEYIVRKLLGLRYPLLWLHFKMVKFNGELSELNFLQPKYSI